MMHPRIQELLEYAEARRAELLEAVAVVPERLRSRRPSTDAWSVAEVLEHLHVVERAIVQLISRKLDKARTAGLAAETETESLLRSLDRFALAEGETPMPAPEFVRPPGKLSAGEAVAALAESRQSLREALAAGNGLALGSVTAPHVLLGPLTLYEWVLFAGQHECRHTKQVAEIARQLSNPSVAGDR